MTDARIRKILTVVEETHGEVGQKVNPPSRKAAAIAVIENPCAGKYVDDLEPLMVVGQELGALLGKKAVEALGVPPGEVESYGKAAIVGEAGEREHAAAILHPRLGKPLRTAVEKGDAIIPSAKKIGGLGTAIDVPLHYKNDEWSFDHFDAMEVSVTDAPRANEIVVVIAVTDSGRPFARVKRPPMEQIRNSSG